MARVLLTGFEPFGKHHENISQDVANSISKRILVTDPWSDLREKTALPIDVYIETRILSVDEKGSLNVADSLQKGEQWDAILHVGLCDSCEIPRLESRAQDILDMKISDNDGRHIQQSPLTGQGDLFSTAPLDAWMNLSWPVDVELSNNAGTFLCNETFYRTLWELNRSRTRQNAPTPCLFLHLPAPHKFSLELATVLVHEIIARILFKPVLKVVCALIRDDDEYLIAKRLSWDTHAHKWEFPGGKVEPGESLEHAIEREMREEFGWKVRAQPSIGRFFHSLSMIDIALDALPCELMETPKDLTDSKHWTAHQSIQWRNINDESVIDWLGNDEAIVEWMRSEFFGTKSK